MAIKQSFLGNVKEGKIILDDQPGFERVKGFLEGQPIRLTLGKEYKSRSLDQNNYYWGIVVQMIFEHTGQYDTPDECHLYLGTKFWGTTKEIMGETIRDIKSTPDMSTVEFEENMTKVRNWASRDLGLFIPKPNEKPEDWLKV